MYQRILALLKRAFNPVFVFVALQLVWLSLTLLWVIWFNEELEVLASLTSTLDSAAQSHRESLITMVAGCVLLGVLFIGTFLLFLFGQKQRKVNSQHKQFLSSVTHELRSPLTSLQLTLETFEKRQLEPGLQKKLISMALQDVERLSRNVNHILISAKLDRGIEAFIEESETVWLAHILNQVCEGYLGPEPSSQSRIKIIYAQSEIKLHVAKLPLTLVLGNLIDNALKYSPLYSCVEILVAKELPYVHIQVRDQGMGIEQADLKKIFRIFYRARMAHKKAIKGTGLGLFIVSTMAKLMGGRVWAESRGLGFGSTFHVLLPIDQRDRPSKWSFFKRFTS